MMRRKANFLLLSLMVAIAFIAISYNAKAVDVCASVTLTSDNAKQSCQSTCGTAENWSGQWTTQASGTTCSNNSTNSVCGCYLYPTCFCDKNGEQIANCLMPSSCPGGFSSCDCPKGTSCDNFTCQPNGGGTPCQQCNSNCLMSCQGVPVQGRADCQTSCFAQCESNVCKNTNAKGKLPQTKIPNKKIVGPLTPPSATVKEASKENSQPEKEAVPSTPKPSPTVEEAPKENSQPEKEDAPSTPKSSPTVKEAPKENSQPEKEDAPSTPKSSPTVKEAPKENSQPEKEAVPSTSTSSPESKEVPSHERQPK
ncbi:MAG: hypothetical protein H0X26_06095 [Alphaproteobacteria bacterium]|nr:hypothetical protein [Alphaproteobacteria bacterium]